MMANFNQFTRSRHEGDVGDEAGVKALLDEYHVEPTIEIEDGSLVVYGYCGFNVWAVEDGAPDYSDPRTREFLFRLADLLDGELVIKTVGHEKLRYVSGVMWRVSDGEVYHATLEDNEAKVPREVIQ